MKVNSQFTLTHFQKWKLGFSLAIIYIPIRVYINVAVIDQKVFSHKLPLWIVSLIVSVIFFTFWITFIEWLQQYLHKLFGDVFLFEFKFPSQLTTLVIAIELAVLFNSGFRTLWRFMEVSLDPLYTVNNPPPSTPQLLYMENQRKRLNNGLTVMALMAAFYLAANRRVYQRLQEVHSNSERLEKENVKAQFNALKNQVSPHFMFNNFSVLSSLIESDPELSIQFVNQLSKAYRYILEQASFDHIKLRTELEFVQTYTFLLKTRFEEKLKVEIEVSEYERDHYSIVPLTLQLLIENAVKHNQMSSDNPLIVTIRTKDLQLIVSNPLQLRPVSEPSTGLGLQNIINRYSLLKSGPVKIGEQEGRFVVKIPLIT